MEQSSFGIDRGPPALAHIIHEPFYSNRRYAAATSLASWRFRDEPS
jgi:hypothetical protein